MLNKQLIYAAVILNLGLSATAFAGGFGSRMANFAAQYDTNGDGTVTVEEIQAGRAEEFQQNDANGDAVLSLEELKTLMENKRNERIQTRFTELDTDGNGTLSVTEFQAGASEYKAYAAPTLFGLADTNGDNALDSAEMAVLKSPEGRVWKHFARMDTDGDGVISETEFTENLPMKGGRGRHHGHRF